MTATSTYPWVPAAMIGLVALTLLTFARLGRRYQRRHPRGIGQLLADAEQRQVDAVVKPWREIRYPTPAADRPAAEAALALLFAAAGRPPPTTVRWARSPRELSTIVLDWYERRITHGSDPSAADDLPPPNPAERATLRWIALLHAARGRGIDDGGAIRDLVDLPRAQAVTSNSAYAYPTAIDMAVSVALDIGFGSDDQLTKAVRPALVAANLPRDGLIGARFAYLIRALAHTCAVDLWGVRPAAWVEPVLDLARACGDWYLGGELAVLCEPPVEVHSEQYGWLHADDGPAATWSDGFAVYAHHGLALPPWVFTDPIAPTIERIQAEEEYGLHGVLVERYGRQRYLDALLTSAELLQAEPRGDARNAAIAAMGGYTGYVGWLAADAARIAAELDPFAAGEALARHGLARFVQAVGEVIDSDLDSLGQPRRLWRAERRSGHPVVVVELRNTTPDPDGIHAPAWLRVPTGIETCQQAVAWSFGLEPADYAPTVES